MVVEDGNILDVVRSPRLSELPAERREVPGFICPGFVDLQINGALGIDVGTDARALEALGRELPKTGVTSFLPTAISWPAERYADFVDAIREAPNSPSARILGMLHTGSEDREWGLAEPERCPGTGPYDTGAV